MSLETRRWVITVSAGASHSVGAESTVLIVLFGGTVLSF